VSVGFIIFTEVDPLPEAVEIDNPLGALTAAFDVDNSQLFIGQPAVC